MAWDCSLRLLFYMNKYTDGWYTAIVIDSNHHGNIVLNSVWNWRTEREMKWWVGVWQNTLDHLSVKELCWLCMTVVCVHGVVISGWLTEECLILHFSLAFKTHKVIKYHICAVNHMYLSCHVHLVFIERISTPPFSSKHFAISLHAHFLHCLVSYHPGLHL